MIVGFGHVIGSQPLCAVERMCHRRHIESIDGLQLVDEADDVRQLGLNVGDLVRRDLESGEHAELVDVFAVE